MTYAASREFCLQKWADVRADGKETEDKFLKFVAESKVSDEMKLHAVRHFMMERSDTLALLQALSVSIEIHLIDPEPTTLIDSASTTPNNPTPTKPPDAAPVKPVERSASMESDVDIVAVTEAGRSVTAV